MTWLRIRAAEWLILIGCALFIFALWLSAYLEADIRRLHFFQAWMYFAAIGLSLRRNRWGYFIGLSAAAFWDYSNLFVTTFFRNGLHWLSVSINNGELQRLDQLVAVPAWVGNFLVVVGSLWGYGRLQEKHPTDIWRFVFALVLTTAFFAADMYLYQPRYLSLFPRLLHPHWP